MSPTDTWSKLQGSAKAFRRTPTIAEQKLWDAIRNRKVGGARFRRQHANDRYLVDFYCAASQLVVEVDGPVHDSQTEQDALRQDRLERLGLKILRFTNEDVVNDLDVVIARIAEAVS
jgi:very-short-patch-repair endonuclease